MSDSHVTRSSEGADDADRFLDDANPPNRLAGRLSQEAIENLRAYISILREWDTREKSSSE